MYVLLYSRFISAIVKLFYFSIYTPVYDRMKPTLSLPYSSVFCFTPLTLKHFKIWIGMSTFVASRKNCGLGCGTALALE